MLVHRTVTPSSKFTSTHLHLGGEMNCETKCQEEGIRQEKTESQEKSFSQCLKNVVLQWYVRPTVSWY